MDVLSSVLRELRLKSAAYWSLQLRAPWRLGFDGGRLAGPGEPTTILCGAFFFGDEDHPAVAGFPRCIHVPAQPGGAPDWLTSLTQGLTKEITDGGCGQRSDHSPPVGCTRDPSVASLPGDG